MIVSVVAFVAACNTTKKQTPAASTDTKPALECSSMNITFSGEIKSILETHCSKCHNSNNKAGYNFLTLESAIKAGKDGHLLGTIKHEKGYDKMPIGAPKLSQELIDKLECWVNNGMPE